jgi:hypothetical protein
VVGLTFGAIAVSLIIGLVGMLTLIPGLALTWWMVKAVRLLTLRATAARWR